MLGKAARGRFWLVLLLFVLLPLIVLLAWRKELAAWAITRALQEEQVAVASLEVVELGWASAKLRRFSAAVPGIALDLDSADLEYSMAGLAAGVLPEVSLAGLDLQVDPASPWLKARMTEQPGGSAEETEGLPPIPDVALEDAELRLLTSVGWFELSIEGSLWRDPTAAMIASVSLAAKAEQGESTAVLGVTVTPDRSLLADLVIEEGSLDVGGLKVRGFAGSLSAAFNGKTQILENLQSDFAATEISGALSPEIGLEPVELTFGSRLEERDLAFSTDISGAGSLNEDFLIAISGRFEQQESKSHLSFASRAEAAASIPFLTGISTPLPQSGRVTTVLDAELELPLLAELLAVGLPARPEELVELVRSLDAEYSLQAEGLSHPAFLEGLSAETKGVITLDGDAFAIALNAPASLQITSLSAQLLNRFAPNQDLRNWLAAPLVARLSAYEADVPLLQAARSDVATGPYVLNGKLDVAGDALEIASRLSGQLTPFQESWSLEGPLKAELRALPLRSLSGIAGRSNLKLSGRYASTEAGTNFEGDLNTFAKTLRKEDLRLDGVTADLALRAELSEQVLHVTATKPGHIDLQSLTSSAAKSTTPLSLQILSAEIETDLEDGAVRPKVAATLAPAEFVLGEKPDHVDLESATLDLTISPHPTENNNFAIRAETESVSVPGVQLRAADIAVQTSADPVTGIFSGKVESLRLEDLAVFRRFEDVQISSSFRGTEAGRIGFEGQGYSFQEALAFTFDGRSDPKQGTSVDVVVPEHDFASKALTIRNLSWLSEAEIDQGRLAGELRLEMTPGGPKGYAQIESDGLSGKLVGFPFSNLSMTAGLDSLWPPRTSAPIRIDLANVNPGLPISNLHIEAELQDAAPFTLDLQDAALTLLGTQISLQGGRLALLEGTADLPIRITGLDLAEILKQADLADVEVSGRLTGDLPISFNDGAVTVRPSKLAATEPGVLRVQSEEISSLLTGYGDEVNSMLRALEDFHYEDLSLTLEKTAEDDLTLLLSILGKNPAVLQGQPFQINLNLESNIGQILDTLGEGLEISKDLLSGRYSLQ